MTLRSRSLLPVHATTLLLLFAACSSGGGDAPPASTVQDGNADLQALTISTGTLSPAFNPAVTSYTVGPALLDQQVRVTATAASDTASVRVQGVEVLSGQQSNPINLSLGLTTVTVQVLSEDGRNNRTYSIAITRESDPGSVSVSNLDIDGQGALAVVTRNTPFGAVADFTITNPENCPTCIRQIVVGFDDTGRDCLFDSVPAVAGESGTSTVTLLANEVGTFDLRWMDNFQFNCPDAIGLFTTAESEAIGSFTVVDEDLFSFVPEFVDVNGQGRVATVAAGSSVTLEIDFRVWGASNCPTCILQAVIGLENQPLECAFNGIASVFPGQTGFRQIVFPAPTAPGTYRIRYRQDFQFSCIDAQTNYVNDPPLENAIATIIVN